MQKKYVADFGTLNLYKNIYIMKKIPKMRGVEGRLDFSEYSSVLVP